MTAHEVVAYLRTSINTLYYWRKLKKGPPAIRFGRELRYPEHLLEQWMKEQLDG